MAEADPEDVSNLAGILNDLRACASNDVVLSHGDASLQNWFSANGAVFPVDFEFCGFGNPATDMGSLLASVLIQGGFARQSFKRAGEGLRLYRGLRPLDSEDVKFSLLSSLILDAAAAPSNFRKFILNNCRQAIDLI
jgi:aminoglycoside phosphotransferase (APT) family kinase protein